MNNYEGMFLLDSTRFANNADGVTNEVLGILEKAGAEVVAHRPWQEGRLAYEIQGRRKGVHYLVLFRMDGQGVETINQQVKLSEPILRHLIIRQQQSVFDAMVSALQGGGESEQPQEQPPAEEPPVPEEEIAEVGAESS